MAIENKRSPPLPVPVMEATAFSKRKREAPLAGEEPISKCHHKADGTEERVERVAQELLRSLNSEIKTSTQLFRRFITRIVPRGREFDYEQLSLIKNLVNGSLGIYFNDDEHHQIIRMVEKLETSEELVQSILRAPSVAEDLELLVHWDHSGKDCEEDDLPRHHVSRALLLNLLSSVFQYDESNCYAIAALNYYQRQYPLELVNFLKKVLNEGHFDFRGQKLSAASLFEIYGELKDDQNTSLQELLLKIFEFVGQNATKDLEEVRAQFPEQENRIYLATSVGGRGHAIVELKGRDLVVYTQKKVIERVRKIFEPKIEGRKEIAAYEIHPLGGNPPAILKENLLELPPVNFQRAPFYEFRNRMRRGISFLQYVQHVSLLDPAEIGVPSPDDEKRVDRAKLQFYPMKKLKYALCKFLDKDQAMRFVSVIPPEGMQLKDFAKLIKDVDKGRTIVNWVVYSVDREAFAKHFTSIALEHDEAYLTTLSAARTLQVTYLKKNLGYYSLSKLQNIILDILGLPRIVFVCPIYWDRDGRSVHLVISHDFFGQKRCYYYECLDESPIMPVCNDADFPADVITPLIQEPAPQ